MPRLSMSTMRDTLRRWWPRIVTLAPEVVAGLAASALFGWAACVHWQLGIVTVALPRATGATTPPFVLGPDVDRFASSVYEYVCPLPAGRPDRAAWARTVGLRCEVIGDEVAVDLRPGLQRACGGAVSADEVAASIADEGDMTVDVEGGRLLVTWAGGELGRGRTSLDLHERLASTLLKFPRASPATPETVGHDEDSGAEVGTSIAAAPALDPGVGSIGAADGPSGETAPGGIPDWRQTDGTGPLCILSVERPDDGAWERVALRRTGLGRLGVVRGYDLLWARSVRDLPAAPQVIVRTERDRTAETKTLDATARWFDLEEWETTVFASIRARSSLSRSSGEGVDPVRALARCLALLRDQPALHNALRTIPARQLLSGAQFAAHPSLRGGRDDQEAGACAALVGLSVAVSTHSEWFEYANQIQDALKRAGVEAPSPSTWQAGDTLAALLADSASGSNADLSITIAGLNSTPNGGIRDFAGLVEKGYLLPSGCTLGDGDGAISLGRLVERERRLRNEDDHVSRRSDRSNEFDSWASDTAAWLDRCGHALVPLARVASVTTSASSVRGAISPHDFAIDTLYRARPWWWSVSLGAGFGALALWLVARRARRRADAQQFAIQALRHEIADPITTVRLAGGRLSAAAGHVPGCADAALDLNQAAEDLERLLDDWKWAASLASGDPMPVERADSLGTVVRDVVARVPEFATRHGKPLEGSAPIVRLGAAANVAVLPTLVRVCLTNLLRNAVRHGARPGEPLRLTVTAQLTADLVVLAVEDNGRGFPRDGVDSAFDKAYRGKAAAAAGVLGFGLGLHLVRRFARRAGGDAFIESPGNPTRVAFSFARTPSWKVDSRRSNP